MRRAVVSPPDAVATGRMKRQLALAEPIRTECCAPNYEVQAKVRRRLDLWDPMKGILV